jgi:nitrogen regulatory protein P-II 1
MKLVIAYVQPEKVGDVKAALAAVGVGKLSISNALGCGRQGGYVETYRGVHDEINLLKKVRIEIGVNDNFVDTTMKAIIQGARTGKIGDGKIFVVPLEHCVRIRTGETGSEAIG